MGQSTKFNSCQIFQPYGMSQCVFACLSASHKYLVSCILCHAHALCSILTLSLTNDGVITSCLETHQDLASVTCSMHVGDIRTASDTCWGGRSQCLLLAVCTLGDICTASDTCWGERSQCLLLAVCTLGTYVLQVTHAGVKGPSVCWLQYARWGHMYCK